MGFPSRSPLMARTALSTRAWFSWLNCTTSTRQILWESAMIFERVGARSTKAWAWLSKQEQASVNCNSRFFRSEWIRRFIQNAFDLIDGNTHGTTLDSSIRSEEHTS